MFVPFLLGDGCAVLLRSLDPVEGHEQMKKGRCRKGKDRQLKDHELCGGPAKLTMVSSGELCMKGRQLTAFACNAMTDF